MTIYGLVSPVSGGRSKSQKPARRLPRGLKKKLEASLMNLTPKESARLEVIYYHEADKRTGSFLSALASNPPEVDELESAWDSRLNAANKKGPDAYNALADQRNGYVFLRSLALDMNMWVDRDVWRLLYWATSVTSTIDRLLLLDAVGAVGRMVRNRLVDAVPRPISRQDYELLTQWAERDYLVSIEGLIEDELLPEWEEEYAEANGLTYLTVPTDFRDDNLAAVGAKHPWEIDRGGEKAKALRRLWLDAQGDEFIQATFKGRQDLVNDWVENGGYAEALTEDVDTRRGEEYDRLLGQIVARIDSGEIPAVQTVFLPGFFGDVALKDGKLPAWAALRAIWKDWVLDQGYQVGEQRVHEKKRSGYEPVSNLEGEVEGDALTALVAQFIDDCRTKPWGDGLADDIDPEALADFLVEADDPLTPYYAPDVGLVDYDVFRQAEGLSDSRHDVGWAIRAEDLKLNRAALGLPEDYNNDGGQFIFDMYYPTDRPEDRRQDMARIMDMIWALRVDNPPFTYPNKIELRQLYGVEFLTPLEAAVGRLADGFSMIASLRKALDILSDEFFDGLPVIMPSVMTKVDQVEAQLVEAEQSLNEWIDRLSDWPWEVEGVEAIRPRRGTADPDQVGVCLAGMVGEIVRAAQDRPIAFEPGRQFNPRDWLNKRLHEIVAQLQAELGKAEDSEWVKHEVD